MFLAVVLPLLLFAARVFAEDSCATLFKDSEDGVLAVLPFTEENGLLALDCLRSLDEINSVDTEFLVKSFKRALKSYAFLDDLRFPPRSIQEGSFFDSIDIMGRLDQLDPEYMDKMELIMELQNIISLARDGHAGYTFKEIDNMAVTMPLLFCPTLENDNLVIRICQKQTMTDIFDDITGTLVKSINGKDPVQFFEDLADKTKVGRDISQRFELLMETQIVYSLRELLKRKEDHSLDFSGFDFTKLDVTLEDGQTIDVNMKLYALLPGSLMNRMEARTEVETMDTRQRILQQSQYLGGSPALIKNGKTRAGKPKWLDSSMPKQLQAPILAGIECDDEDTISETFIEYRTDEDNCVLIVKTFLPNNYITWVTELGEAFRKMRADKCGIVTNMGEINGRRLVLDFRRNTGGSVGLEYVLLSTLFQKYTPHNTMIITTRLPSDSDSLTDLFHKAEGMDKVPYREPFTLKTIDACGENAGCEKWKDNPITRTFDRDQLFTRPTMNPLLWREAPVLMTETLRDEWRFGDGHIKYGNMAQFMLSARDMADILGNYQPEPELTVFLFGPYSASASAGIATVALSYNLGAVIRQGYPGHNPVHAAMVPGGNVVNYNIVQRQTTTLADISKSSNFTFTTWAYVPLTTEIAEEYGQYTPLEFVPMPPHYVMPYWPVMQMNEMNEWKTMLAELQKTLPIGHCVTGQYSHYAAANCSKRDFPHAEYVGRLCDDRTGEYTGSCGVVRCQYGYELVNGNCLLVRDDLLTTYQSIKKAVSDVLIEAQFAIGIALLVILVAIIVIYMWQCCCGSHGNSDSKQSTRWEL